MYVAVDHMRLEQFGRHQTGMSTAKNKTNHRRNKKRNKNNSENKTREQRNKLKQREGTRVKRCSMKCTGCWLRHTLIGEVLRYNGCSFQ